MRRIVLHATVLAALLFGGCIPKEERTALDATKEPAVFESKKDLSGIRVGYCSPTQDASFYVALSKAIQSGAESMGMQFLVTDGQGDISKQVAAVEDLLAKGVEVLILNPIDPKALIPVIQQARNQGVAVFIVDSFIEEQANYIAAVFADNNRNGEILGQWLAARGGGPYRVAIISGNQGNAVGREKRLGFIRGLSDGQMHASGATNFVVKAQGWGGWNNTGGLKAMEDILVAHPDINVLLAENDAMAMGALKAIREMKKEKQITVLGYDAQKEALDMIIKGEYAATAQNSPVILGKTIVETVARYLNDPQSVKRINFTPSVLIDKTNAAAFYNPDALF